LAFSFTAQSTPPPPRRLQERRGSRDTDLSGGEQQMLAIGALICEPKIILLDEPFEGLAPVIVHDFVKACRNLADAGQRPGGAESRCSR
jgi:branched-chain amino acid transport system ATP-binding protein